MSFYPDDICCMANCVTLLLAKARVYVSVPLGLAVDVEVLLHADDPVPVRGQQPEQVLTLPLRHPQPRHPLQRSLEIFFAITEEVFVAR